MVPKNHLSNDNPPEDRSQAAAFSKAIFGQQAGGFLEIRILSEPGQPPQLFFPLPSELDKAAASAISLRNQLYYSVAPRTRQEGTADAVAILTSAGIELVTVEGDTVVLSFRYAVHKAIMERPENQHIADQVISNFFGRPMHVSWGQNTN